MKIITNTAEELVGRHNANSDLFWVAMPLPILLLGAIFSDVVATPMQTLILIAISLALFVIVVTKIEWTTLRLECSDQRVEVQRRKLIGKTKHNLPLSDVIKARPDVFYHDTGDKSHRLVLEVRGAGEAGAPVEIPLVGVAKDWDAQAVADQINAWLVRYRSSAGSPWEERNH